MFFEIKLTLTFMQQIILALHLVMETYKPNPNDKAVCINHINMAGLIKCQIQGWIVI